MTTRSLLRRLKRIEQDLPSVDELYASIIWDFALTADDKALQLLKDAFATVTGQPLEQEKTQPNTSPPPEPEEPDEPEESFSPLLEAFKPVALPGQLKPFVPPEPGPPPASNFRAPIPPDEGASPEEMAAFEAELRESEARRQMFIDEHVRWRPRGEPAPYPSDGGDDDPSYPYGRVIVDYDPLDPKYDYIDWDK